MEPRSYSGQPAAVFRRSPATLPTRRVTMVSELSLAAAHDDDLGGGSRSLNGVGSRAWDRFCTGDWRSDLRSKVSDLSPWEADLRSRVRSIADSMRNIVAGRRRSTEGHHAAHSPMFVEDYEQRQNHWDDDDDFEEDHCFQVNEELSEFREGMIGLFEKWRCEDAILKAARSTEIIKDPHMHSSPVRSNYHNTLPNQDSPSTFDLAPVGNVNDNGEKKGKLLDDSCTEDVKEEGKEGVRLIVKAKRIDKEEATGPRKVLAVRTSRPLASSLHVRRGVQPLCLMKKRFEMGFKPEGAGVWLTIEAFNGDYSYFCSRQRLAVQFKSSFKKSGREGGSLRRNHVKSKKKGKDSDLKVMSTANDGVEEFTELDVTREKNSVEGFDTEDLMDAQIGSDNVEEFENSEDETSLTVTVVGKRSAATGATKSKNSGMNVDKNIVNGLDDATLEQDPWTLQAIQGGQKVLVLDSEDEIDEVRDDNSGKEEDNPMIVVQYKGRKSLLIFDPGGGEFNVRISVKLIQLKSLLAYDLGEALYHVEVESVDKLLASYNCQDLMPEQRHDLFPHKIPVHNHWEEDDVVFLGNSKTHVHISDSTLFMVCNIIAQLWTNGDVASQNGVFKPVDKGKRVVNETGPKTLEISSESEADSGDEAFNGLKLSNEHEQRVTRLRRRFSASWRVDRGLNAQEPAAEAPGLDHFLVKKSLRLKRQVQEDEVENSKEDGRNTDEVDSARQNVTYTPIHEIAFSAGKLDSVRWRGEILAIAASEKGTTIKKLRSIQIVSEECLLQDASAIALEKLLVVFEELITWMIDNGVYGPGQSTWHQHLPSKIHAQIIGTSKNPAKVTKDNEENVLVFDPGGIVFSLANKIEKPAKVLEAAYVHLSFCVSALKDMLKSTNEHLGADSIQKVLGNRALTRRF